MRERPFQNPVKDLERFRNITVAFNYFRKTLYLTSLRGFWICIRFWIYQGSRYSRIVSMPEFRISRISLYLFFFIRQGSEYGSDSNYERVLNISEFQVSAYACLTKGSEYASKWLNNVWINCSDYDRVLKILGQVSWGFAITCCTKCKGLEYDKLVNMPGLHRMLIMLQ